MQSRAPTAASRQENLERKGFGWVVLIAVLLSLVSWRAMFAAYPHSQLHDARLFHKMIEAGRMTISRYHELPLWNPFECGGMPMWDNPQGVMASPLTWLTFLIGTTATLDVWFLLHSALGVLCMWVFARGELRLSPAASLVASASWAFAGVYNQHFTGGHLIWVAFLYFPLALLLWRRAERNLTCAIWLGLLVALAVFEGATYPLPYLAVMLGLETVFRVRPVRRLVPIAKAGLVVVLVAFTVGAMRFLPLMDQLAHHHRDIPADTDAMKWSSLKDVFLAREHGRKVDGQQYVWPEFGDYIGPFLLGLAILGLFTVTTGELWLVGLFVFAFSLMCGHFATYAPWSVLNAHVFPFVQMRVPSRFVAIVTMFLSVFAGFAIDRLPRRLRSFRFARGPAFRGFLIALALIGIGDEIGAGASWSVQAFAGGLQAPKTPADRFHYEKSLKASIIEVPSTNTADLKCWEEWAFYRDAPIWLGDVPQAKAETKGLKVGAVVRTPNSFTIDVDASGPGRVLLNSAYDRGWRTNKGEVLEDHKMIAVDVPPGKYQLIVRYWPHGLTAGFVLTGLGLGSLLTLAVVRWRQRRRGSSPVTPGMTAKVA